MIVVGRLPKSLKNLYQAESTSQRRGDAYRGASGCGSTTGDPCFRSALLQISDHGNTLIYATRDSMVRVELSFEPPWQT